MQRRLVAWLVLVLVVLAACSEGSAKGGQIEGTRWVLRSFDEAGTQTLVQGAAYADARFSSGRVRGFAGCGTYDALARANGRTLMPTQGTSPPRKTTASKAGWAYFGMATRDRGKWSTATMGPWGHWHSMAG